VALACAFAMPLSARVAPLPGGTARALRLGPIGEALRQQLAGADPGLAAFYRARNYRPIWIQGWGLRPDARSALQALRAAPDDGLDPQAYGESGLPELLGQAGSHAPSDLARAEIGLSRAVSGYLADLHVVQPGAEMIYADPAVAPPRLDRAGVLRVLAAAPSPAAAVADLQRMNPIYLQLRAALAANRDPARAGLIRANMERARALPADLGRRYVLVDAAAQTLRLYQDGRAVESMPVVVGKLSEPTPAMAGLIRYAVVRPYWNIPPDLVAHTYAPKVLTYGPAWLDSQNMEALSDWSADATVLAPETIDWAAVAAGRQVLRVRQRPGERNMMGRVKFIFPNALGVYLHDSPLRQYFGETRRTESAGCVRLSDAPRLARWLLADQAAQVGQPGAPETRIDLDRPVPVYIVYLTAAPEGPGLSFRPDIYHRDRPLEARLAAAPARA
jgi:murein L,D-transpeptidase YcbB/YkuD